MHSFILGRVYAGLSYSMADHFSGRRFSCRQCVDSHRYLVCNFISTREEMGLLCGYYIFHPMKTYLLLIITLWVSHTGCTHSPPAPSVSHEHKSVELNDIHSQLNATKHAAFIMPKFIEEIQFANRAAKTKGNSLTSAETNTRWTANNLALARSI